MKYLTEYRDPVTNDHPKQVILTSSIGGRRMLNMLTVEQLPRIC